MDIVCNQVAGSNRSIVQMHSSQVDNILSSMEKYLHSMAFQDQNIVYITSGATTTMEDYYANLSLLIKFQKDLFEYDYSNAIFLYKAQAKELITASRNQNDTDKINAKLGALFEDPAVRKKLTAGWELFNMEGQYFLLKWTDTGYGTYIGIWVNLEDLLKPIRFLEFKENEQVMFATSEGLVLTGSSTRQPLKRIGAELLRSALNEKVKPYSILKSLDNGSESMVVSVRSGVSGLYLVVLLPVNTLLENLTFFQRVIYITPFVAVAFLFFFLLYLQRSIASPIKKLIRGMKKIQSGDLTARLNPSHLSEFNTINEAFNDMADQIEYLKSDIYEEQIRAQKAEMKELQAQIYPHFFANCLNLVYSLAQVKNTELVQKLTLHLVRHLTFMTRTNRTLVTLSEELDHINNYLSIQKIRFPKAFDYSIDIEQELGEMLIPAFILLPFVENSMEHGFCYRENTPFQVSVKVAFLTDGNEKCISIKTEDNGLGFSPEILEELQSGSYIGDDADQHIGIWNVQRRCQLYYHSEVRLLFSNSPQGGAVVEMILPIA
jgi:two-component system sensor histidine kinase YesM